MEKDFIRKIPDICDVSDCYKFILRNCIQSIEECSEILFKCFLLNIIDNDTLSLEIEYSTFMLKYLKVILRSIESKKIYKIEILLLKEFLHTEFCRLRKKYESNNHLNYFSVNDLSLFMRNIKFFLEVKRFGETKMGLVYFRYLDYYLNKLKAKLAIYNKEKFVFKNTYDIFNYSFRNFQLKFLCIVLSYYIAPLDEHLFNLQTNHHRWKEIYKNLEINLVRSFEEGKNAMKWSTRITNYMHALYYTINYDKFNSKNIFQVIKLIYFSIYFWVKPNIAKYTRRYHLVNPNFKIIRMIFEALENKLVKVIFSFFMGKVKFCDKKFIHSFNKYDLLLYTEEYVRFLSRSSFTQITILSNSVLIYKVFSFKDIFNIRHIKESLSSFISKKIMISQTPSIDVIFHVHGGGFFSQTSESSKVFLTDWVNKFKTVIFSVDYQVAPENKYPNLIDENLRAYEKIIMNTKEMFGFEIRKLIITGDSGGGLICLNIIKHAIKNKLLIPDGLVLLYPCSRIIYDSLTPSLLMSLKDNYIDPSIVLNLQRIVLELDKYDLSYYKNEDNLDFFKSDPDIIQRFPKTIITIASNDPLRDEGYMLADFLLRSKVDVKIKEFLFFCHGFINMTKFIQTYYHLGKEEIEKFMSTIFL